MKSLIYLHYYLLENSKGESVHLDLEQRLAEVEGNFLNVIRDKIEKNI